MLDRILGNEGWGCLFLKWEGNIEDKRGDEVTTLQQIDVSDKNKRTPTHPLAPAA